MEATELDKAIVAFRESNERLTKALWEEDARAARLYYQSGARPLDEARLNAIHGIADRIDKHRKANSYPTQAEMDQWSLGLWNA